MRTALLYFFGVVPAVTLTLGSILLAFVSPETGILVCIGALLGTYGILWSMASYSSPSAGRVLFLLSAGIITVGAALVMVAMTLRDDLEYERLTAAGWIGKIILSGWMYGGPFIVGVTQWWSAFRRLRTAERGA